MSSLITNDVERIIEQVHLQKLKNKRILLTGSNGLFGRYITVLISILNKKHHFNTTLYGVSLHKPNKDIAQCARNDSHIIPLAIDLSQPFTFNKKVDYILHAACYAQPQKFITHKFETIELNVNATRILLNIAKKYHARFLFFSSAEVYGDIPKEQIPVPESYNGNIATFGVRSIYGESKRLGETICSMYRRDEHTDASVVRISHAYGPGISPSDKRVLGEFLYKALQLKRITLKDQGTAVKTWGYIADIVTMILNVLMHSTELIYNVGGVHTITVKELAEEIAKYTKSKVIIPSKKSNISTDPQLVKLDISKYEKEFGRPKFISFSEGIQRTIAWNREEITIK